MRPVKVFVSPRGNAFMTDIAGWITEGARLLGRDAELVTDRLPLADGSINLSVAPHELFTLADASDADVARAAAASVAVCTEQPGTPWFNLAAELVRECPLTLDINPRGVAAYRARGVECEHLRLGGVPSMRAGKVERDLDVLFLGGSTPRRNARLASLAPQLWQRRCELRLFRFSSPVGEHVPGVVFGADKYALLSRATILLNIHRDDELPGYFEWARMVEAMANGCAVLTEPSVDYQPLVDGTHFVAAEELGPALTELLADRRRCRELGEAARSAVLERHPLTASLEPLLDRLDAAAPEQRRRQAGRRPPVRSHRPPLLPEFRPATTLRRRVYHALLAEQRLLREIEGVRCQLERGSADNVEELTTPSYADARPQVSVIVTLYNYASFVIDALDSIAASHDIEFEVVVVDDHSRDDGRAAVTAFMQAHPDLPMLLLGRDVNGGLPAARNLAIAAARAAKVMVMDADNLVYPNCLARLAAALDAEPAAAFAYATLEAFGHEPGLRSELAWYPPWLCETNYIDAQAMVRRSVYERHGGYRGDDDLVYGWEDWELWLRLAEAGECGVHLPEMLGRYRTQPSSMVSITNLVADDMRAHLRWLHPTLPWPEGPAATGEVLAGVPDRGDDEAGLRAAIESARRESEALRQQLPALSRRLGAARRRQDALQRGRRSRHRPAATDQR